MQPIDCAKFFQKNFAHFCPETISPVKLKKYFALILLFNLAYTTQAQFGKLPPFTKWHQNPLGFQPLNLHTSNAIIVPGVAAAICLLLTPKDTAITRKISWFEEVGYAKGYYASRTNVWQNNFGLLFHAREWLALGGEVSAYHVGDEVNNTWGFGLRPFVRFYPLQLKRLRLYFESGAGVIWFVKKFPQPSGFFGDNRRGTNWNGSPKYGIGAEWQLNERLSLQIGIRHVHVSNGNTWGEENNPGHDSNGINAGLMIRPIRR